MQNLKAFKAYGSSLTDSGRYLQVSYNLVNRCIPAMKTWAASGVHLQKLEISSDEMTDEGLIAVISVSPYLTFLELMNCKSMPLLQMSPLFTWFFKGIGDNTLIALGKSCRNLQGLGLMRCTLVSDVGVISLANPYVDIHLSIEFFLFINFFII